MSEIKQISECFIKPEFEIEDSKRQYYLNALQLSLLQLNYIHISYIFKKPSNYSPLSHLKKLKFSLSKALVYFYPLAGRLETAQSEDEHSCLIYVNCLKGPGVRVVHASVLSIDICHVLSTNSDVPSILGCLIDLGEGQVVNYDGHSRPLLSVQLTELADAVVLGISVNHCVVDGTSYNHFHQTWSHLFMGSLSSSMSRPLIQNPAVKMPYLDPSEFLSRSASHSGSQFRERFFHFSVSSIKNLKAFVNKESLRNGTHEPVSSFKALSGFIWRCITRARRINPSELTSCTLPVNARPRFHPPLSQDYFGSYYTRAKASAKVGELLENNVGWAASLLHRALLSLDDKAVKTLFERAFDEGPQLLSPSLSLSSNDVVVAGSNRFNIYGPEFGLGVPVGCRGGYGNKYDGKVNCYLGNEGQGSVGLELCLEHKTMTSLLLDQEFMAFVSYQNSDSNLISRI
ncbi:putative acetyltransferase At3g50280 [Silene latifolia]|uniref:putative acetyltransferase At3g50280 n=1 Tax=Silene latifolia TaxID=37657 RepID=UPI003D76C5A9